MHLELLERFVTKPDRAAHDEEIFIVTGVSWEDYEALVADIGDDFPGLHVTYLEGTLEIMSPSRQHESDTSAIGMLLEAYFQETRTRYYPLGSTTFRKRTKARGIEPDECYCVGTDKEFPDLAIEVFKTSGGIDRLEVYRGLAVPEVWFWKNQQFAVYHLRGDSYEKVSRSEFLPELDLTILATYVLYAEPLDAVLEFRAVIRSKHQ
jgi:Uma2 family endonuclease